MVAQWAEVGHGLRRVASPVVVAAIVLASFLSTSPVIVGASSAAARPATPSALPASVPLDARYLTVRPGLGELWVFDLSSLTTGQRLLARTLQGRVNRTQVRLWLTQDGPEGRTQ